MRFIIVFVFFFILTIGANVAVGFFKLLKKYLLLLFLFANINYHKPSETVRASDASDTVAVFQRGHVAKNTAQTQHDGHGCILKNTDK